MENLLARYIRERPERVGQNEIARELGVAPAMVSTWVNGKRRPDLDNAFRIEEMTGGLVPASSWRRQRKPKVSARKHPVSKSRKTTSRGAAA